MGERAKDINFQQLRGTEALSRMKSVYTRVNDTPVTGSMLAETFKDVPEVFANGRFIIVDTKTNGRIGMINPKFPGLNIEYIDLATGEKRYINVNDIKGKTQFLQCMNILDGRGNTREILGNTAVKAGKGTVNAGKAVVKQAGNVTVGFVNGLAWLRSSGRDK